MYSEYLEHQDYCFKEAKSQIGDLNIVNFWYQKVNF